MERIFVLHQSPHENANAVRVEVSLSSSLLHSWCLQQYLWMLSNKCSVNICYVCRNECRAPSPGEEAGGGQQSSVTQLQGVRGGVMEEGS